MGQFIRSCPEGRDSSAWATMLELRLPRQDALDGRYKAGGMPLAHRWFRRVAEVALGRVEGPVVLHQPCSWNSYSAVVLDTGYWSSKILGAILLAIQGRWEHMTDTIFQASDLAGSRRVEFLDAARGGGARLRDRDGMSLVMLPESTLRLLETLAAWWESYTRLDCLLRRADNVPSARDLGDLSWLRSFDRDDMGEFLGELHDALVAASADRDTAVLDNCIKAWRVTARQLEDPLRRSVLTGKHVDSDFIEVSEPK